MNRFIETDCGFFNLELLHPIVIEKGHITTWDAKGNCFVLSKNAEVFVEKIRQVLELEEQEEPSESQEAQCNCDCGFCGTQPQDQDSIEEGLGKILVKLHQKISKILGK